MRATESGRVLESLEDRVGEDLWGVPQGSSKLAVLVTDMPLALCRQNVVGVVHRVRSRAPRGFVKSESGVK